MVRKTKTLAVLNLARDIKGNKKASSGISAIKERPGKMWLFSGGEWKTWLYRREKADVLDDFLASVFTSKCSSQNP